MDASVANVVVNQADVNKGNWNSSVPSKFKF